MDTNNILDISELLDHAEEFGGYMIPCRDDNGTVNLFARSSCGDTLLHVAARRRNSEEVCYLVDRGLDIDARGDFCETPLFSVAASGYIEMVELLLKLGADPNITNNLGELPKNAFLRSGVDSTWPEMKTN